MSGERTTSPLLAGALTLALAGAAIAFVAAGGLEFRSDFIVLYGAARGLWDGVPIYDEVATAAHLADCCGLPDEPYALAYPPHYLALGWPLGLLPLGAAGRLWLLANVAMVAGAVFVLTRDWAPPHRIGAGLMAALFGPTLGMLAVGQLTGPALLGAALLADGATRRASVPLALGLVLLSLKPHLGLAIALLALPAALADRGRGAAVAAGVLAGLAGLAAWIVPGWWADWPAAVLRLSDEEGVVSCDTCASLAVAIEGTGLLSARVAMLGLLVALIALGVWRRKALGRSGAAVGFAAAVALVALAYVRNYDAVVLLVPMVQLWARGDRLARILAGAAWAIPTVALAIPDRAWSAGVTWIAAALLLGGLATAGAEPLRRA